MQRDSSTLAAVSPAVNEPSKHGDLSNEEETIRIDGASIDSVICGSDFVTGQVLAGRYTVVRLLGKGGMGAVYAVEDAEFGGEIVALKTVLPMATSDESVRRFKREIQLARRVTHKNACRVFDVGYHRSGNTNVVFVTMEYLDGGTLSRFLSKHGRLRLVDALPLIQQMCDGLSAIHDVGIIHRDFKSANVVIAPDHRVVVTDFGLACLGANEANRDLAITQSGMLVGSPKYMAPEQVEGSSLTPATDVYALGVVMYEMATSRVPFEGETPAAVALRRLHERPPSARQFASDIDANWESVIARCLEREPTARFQNAADVARSLSVRDASDASTVVVRPSSTSRDYTGAMIASALALALIVTFLWIVKSPNQGTSSSHVVATQANKSAIADFEKLRHDLTNLRSPIHVNLQTQSHKSEFVAGERITYQISTNSTGYLYLLVFSQGNVATCIFPNSADPANNVLPGEIKVPKNSTYEFPVQAPFGPDLHVAIVSRLPLHLGSEETFTWDEALNRIGSRSGLGGRGVGVAPNSASWQASTLLLTSSRGPSRQ